MPEVVRLGIMLTKLFDYLLNLDHPEGASKAKFFLTRGFSRDRPDKLGSALVWQALRDWPGGVLETERATKYRITGRSCVPMGACRRS